MKSSATLRLPLPSASGVQGSRVEDFSGLRVCGLRAKACRFSGGLGVHTGFTWTPE